MKERHCMQDILDSKTYIDGDIFYLKFIDRF